MGSACILCHHMNPKPGAMTKTAMGHTAFGWRLKVYCCKLTSGATEDLLCRGVDARVKSVGTQSLPFGVEA
ncbi:hypothetical protein TNCV_3888481 [Trichonephila clavipes]|nr:hypothetical protein TNCV_3888481 [Trichonephila clavipes]